MNESRIELCFLSYSHLSRLAREVAVEFRDKARIEIVDYAFETALAQARARAPSIDAFVSAGSNAAILRGALDTPVATIKVTGYDILVALRNARQLSRRVGIITYGDTIAELDAVKGLLDIEIVQRAYRTFEEARGAFRALADDGIGVFIGSSIVMEQAEQHNLQGILAYSAASVRQGIQDAIDLARVARLEAARYEQLNGVLHNLQEAVLAVDRAGRVIALNPPMEAVLGLPRQAVLGQPAAQAVPELAVADVLAGGGEERQQVCQINRREWLMSRRPIRELGQVIGAVVTLYDATTIQEADTTLRSQRRNRQHPQARWRMVELQGESPAFGRVRAAAIRFAGAGKTVLITGETGTGKELFAQAIHNASERNDKPFMAINCAAVPETLLESELFGYEGGAFTGSRKGGKRGLIEAAHTGTLFLDEIGDMPVLLQTRLLRVLQEREVVRVGGVMPIPVDVRVIAATHQPLERLVAEQRFRADLYYRLNILRLRVPPLRERDEDIDAMAQAILARSLRGQGSRHDARELLVPLSARLRAYSWPGNVRELENICERISVVFAQYPSLSGAAYSELEIDCPELFPAGARAVSGSGTCGADLAEVLVACNGNRLEAAQRLGISRSTLWRRMRKADLQA